MTHAEAEAARALYPEWEKVFPYSGPFAVVTRTWHVDGFNGGYVVAERRVGKIRLAYTQITREARFVVHVGPSEGVR